MRNCCSVDSVLLMDIINVSNSCNSISLIILKTGRIRWDTVDPENLLQQRHRSVLECSIEKVGTSGKSISYLFCDKSILLEWPSFSSSSDTSPPYLLLKKMLVDSFYFCPLISYHSFIKDWVHSSLWNNPKRERKFHHDHCLRWSWY